MIIYMLFYVFLWEIKGNFMIFYDQNSQFSGTEHEVGQMDTNAQTNKQTR